MEQKVSEQVLLFAVNIFLHGQAGTVFKKDLSAH